MNARMLAGLRMGGFRMRKLLLSTLGFWLAGVGLALAQDSAVEQQRLYDQMMQQPANYGITSAFVAVAVQRADYEAAIGALERVLFYNPSLPQVNFKLGVLYFHLRSYELARNCFEAVLTTPDVPPDIDAEAQTYVAAVDKINCRSRLSYSLRRLSSRIQVHCGRSRPLRAFPTPLSRYRM
jgi:tetratricopeptide (TPR) repeat protein